MMVQLITFFPLIEAQFLQSEGDSGSGPTQLYMIIILSLHALAMKRNYCYHKLVA